MSFYLFASNYLSFYIKFDAKTPYYIPKIRSIKILGIIFEIIIVLNLFYLILIKFNK